ncbi:MAG: 30S ribosomal protein S13 [Candidatus Paceibacterota bacterium]
MRIVGVNIPDDKKIKISLSYVYGVGFSSAQDILEEAGIDPEKRTKDLDSSEVNKIQSILDKKYKIGGELRQVIKQNIQRLKDINSYKGTRHAKGLPVRGQRTKTNMRTRKGNTRKTAGSGKRKIELK